MGGIGMRRSMVARMAFPTEPAWTTLALGGAVKGEESADTLSLAAG